MSGTIRAKLLSHKTSDANLPQIFRDQQSPEILKNLIVVVVIAAVVSVFRCLFLLMMTFKANVLLLLMLKLFYFVNKLIKNVC